jgi:hypothetical protein
MTEQERDVSFVKRDYDAFAEAIDKLVPADGGEVWHCAGVQVGLDTFVQDQGKSMAVTGFIDPVKLEVHVRRLRDGHSRYACAEVRSLPAHPTQLTNKDQRVQGQATRLPT